MEQVERYTIEDEVAWQLRFARRNDQRSYQKAFPDQTAMERFIDNEPDIVVISARTTALTGNRGALL